MRKRHNKSFNLTYFRFASKRQVNSIDMWRYCMRYKEIMVVLTLFILNVPTTLFPCTVFYSSYGNVILGGNNEDYSDPNTGFFLIPAESGKHGWIKFGFMGGWPQGGMNDQGLFWDATGCTFLDMPYSEANKVKYDGPLMQKVMEECGTIEEALLIFEQYYCDDQYRAQYLIGDTTGTSAIIEGDNVIINDKDYQVLTNFYQSNPDLGGYPCWRYDTAVSMLENTDEISTYLFGVILSATHQEGRYPTQYSNIYNLKKKIVYLFYFHNFEEFISIDVNANLAKGSSIYSLEPLFSQIKILGPSSDTKLNSLSVSFRWEGKTTSRYHLYCSTDSTFSDCNPLPVNSPNSFKLNGGVLGTFLVGIVLMAATGRKEKKPFLYNVTILILFLLFISCKDKVTAPSDTNINEISITIENLESNSIYYWKVIAQSEGINNFESESFIQNFTTTN